MSRREPSPTSNLYQSSQAADQSHQHNGDSNNQGTQQFGNNNNVTCGTKPGKTFLMTFLVIGLIIIAVVVPIRVSSESSAAAARSSYVQIICHC